MQFLPSRKLAGGLAGGTLACCLSCLPPSAPAGAPIPYALDLPAQRWQLPDSLKEVSGITWAGEERLAMIQDEKGSIYHFFLDGGKIQTVRAFAPKGDFEDLSIAGAGAWCLRSDGDLYELAAYEGAGAAIKWETDLSSDHDVEGLCRLPGSDTLLLACKAPPLPGSGFAPSERLIYAWDLRLRSLSPQPWLSLSIPALRKQLIEQLAGSRQQAKALEIDPAGDIRPSALAIHPLSGNLYLVSGTDRWLLVLDRRGKLLSGFRLDKDLLPQPESLCFDPAGNLYLASEASKEMPAQLLMYAYQPASKP